MNSSNAIKNYNAQLTVEPELGVITFSNSRKVLKLKVRGSDGWRGGNVRQRGGGAGGTEREGDADSTISWLRTGYFSKLWLVGWELYGLNTKLAYQLYPRAISTTSE